MLDRIGKAILVAILTGGVLLGAYLGFARYLIEVQDRTIELCVDLNDLKRMAAYEKKPLDPVLDEIRKRGIVSIGVFEETLPDAGALGEVYSAKGSGIIRFKDNIPAFRTLSRKDLIKPDRTYIYAPSGDVRRRIYEQLKWALGEKNVKFLEPEILEADEAEDEIRVLGLGISEAQREYLENKGFRIIPRVWNDPRYHLGNLDFKVSALWGFDTIIFDGEEILGYPEALGSLASALKKNKIKYGYVEIVKQDGDQLFRRLMDRQVIRVHSVPKDELKKITKEEAVKRFVRAACERKVRLIYIRPFLPPQVEAFPVEYNLDYLSKVKAELEGAGFVLGRAEVIHPLMVKGWQVVMLGMGVMIGVLFLLNYFVGIPVLLMYIILALFAGGLFYAGAAGYGTSMQKALGALAAITFPSLAVISTLSRPRKASFLLWDSILMVGNIVAETMVGVFLLMGLLADYRFMLGVEVFGGVKLALVLPVLLIALYFILKQGEGSLRERLFSFLNTQVKMITIVLGLLVLGALGVLVARSGNFVLPVPVYEKYFRQILETLLYIRPRSKEFLVGYPFLFLAATALLRGKKSWLWLLASLGAIAPISLFNTFCHIHTPLMVSMIRTINGLALGILIGMFAALIADRVIKM